MKVLLVGFGGAIGTMMRYLLSGIEHRFAGSALPVNTLVINLSGSLVIGLLWGLFEGASIAPAVRAFIFIGILGGFTTFSTFALENFTLLRDGDHTMAFLNIAVANLVGIVLVFAGYAASKMFCALWR